MLYQLSHFRIKVPSTRRGGAESQIRTGDTAIFSRVLYQLSYLGPMVTSRRLPVGGWNDTTGPARPATTTLPDGRSPTRAPPG